jgi:alginate O-acetyltransferase complex protein AlgJ
MCLCFVAALTVPAIDTWARWSQQDRWTAERPRAEWPPPPSSIKSLARFPRRVDAFFEDNFGFRDTLIRWNSFAKVHWLHESPVPSVVIGQDGWLYYQVPGSGRDPAEYKQIEPYAQSVLEAAQKLLEQRQADLAAMGVRYLFVIPPNKHTVYPEYLPLSLALRDYGQRLDSFVRHMRAHSSVPVVDLRADMIRAKGDESFARLYLRNDSHWNSHGGFVAYQVIARRLKEWFPVLPIAQRSDFDISARERPGDLAQMLGMPDEWTEVEYDYAPKASTPTPAPLRAILYADSFGWQTASFLRYSFQQVDFKQMSEGPFRLDEISKERPDIVIDQRLERNLGAL